MNLYPAMRARMGSWTYYIINMKMTEVASEVQFADPSVEHTLSDAMQRALKTKRNKEIIRYLSHDDRFFGSIVVAARGGAPTFSKVRITDDENILAISGVDQSFGVLTFDGGQKYYALDGQHRLKAIKTILDPEAEGTPPEGFPDEKISVLLVMCDEDEDNPEFIRKYRRLFANLNRYAKPIGKDNEIIMDEDDVFAILTRRLISDHSFFQAPGKQKESFKVQTDGKNMKRQSKCFTSLQTLYSMNETLLSSKNRRHQDPNWGNISFKQFRPEEAEIDQLYNELVLYWDVLLEEIPDLYNEPLSMRIHNPEDKSTSEERDHMFFWPIGQEVMARLARDMLDKSENQVPTKSEVKKVLAGLGKIDWDLDLPPWRYIMLAEKEDGSWIMRTDNRSSAIKLTTNIARFMLGIREGNAEEIYKGWVDLLSPQQSEEKRKEMWDGVASKHPSLKID